MGSLLNTISRVLKKFLAALRIVSAAKAGTDFEGLTARLEAAPFQNRFHGGQQDSEVPLNRFRNAGGKLNFYLLCSQGRVGGLEQNFPCLLLCANPNRSGSANQ